MKKSGKNILTCVACIAVIAASMVEVGCSAKNTEKNSDVAKGDNPVYVKVWNYYNGSQKIAFDQQIETFNNTIGGKEGVVVEAFSQGSIDGVEEELMNAAEGKVGAQDMPDLVALYPETAYTLSQKGILADYDKYFTKEELDEFVPGFIEEGRLEEGGPLYIMPVSKSTEVFVYNKTDWAAFEKATGITIDQLKTIEDIVRIAEEYYNWTDSLTPNIANDGKAFFGRDSIDNYMVIGSKQLGHEIFSIKNGKPVMDMDRETLKTLWDNYYIPFINGYFDAYAKYRSDDAKIGRIISLVGSSTSVNYFPEEVTRSDDTKYKIEAGVIPAPLFSKAVNKVAVQQGAGYCMIKSDEKTQKAAALFLKWLTQEEQNVAFSMESGYSPVKKASNSQEEIEKYLKDNNLEDTNPHVAQGLVVSAQIMQNYDTYAAKPFEKAAEARALLKSAMTDACMKDRETVLQLLAQGKTRKDAVAQFATEEYFDQWFQQLNKDAKALIE